MDRVTKICQEVQELSKAELATFRQWFHDFDAQVWDKQFKENVQAGKLDAGANKVLGNIPLFKPKTEN